ncbi:hypothetical protein GCM10029992_64250 [Glycomyces albus]
MGIRLRLKAGDPRLKGIMIGSDPVLGTGAVNEAFREGRVAGPRRCSVRTPPSIGFVTVVYRTPGHGIPRNEAVVVTTATVHTVSGDEEAGGDLERGDYDYTHPHHRRGR